jgi:hypothetical protein
MTNRAWRAHLGEHLSASCFRSMSHLEDELKRVVYEVAGGLTASGCFLFSVA